MGEVDAPGITPAWVTAETPEVVQSRGYRLEWYRKAEKLKVTRFVGRTATRDPMQRWLVLDGWQFQNNVGLLKMLAKVVDDWCSRATGIQPGGGAGG